MYPSIETRTSPKTGRFYVKSPYNARFVEFARNSNGKWIADSKEWAFDARDEARVREALMLYYATDGAAFGPLCTLRVELGSADGDTIRLGGRALVSRKGRDYRVDLGESVVILDGGFLSSGGSVKNPRVDPKDGTVLEVRDFPLALIRSISAKDEFECTNGMTVRVILSESVAEPAPEPVIASVPSPFDAFTTEEIEAELRRRHLPTILEAVA